MLTCPPIDATISGDWPVVGSCCVASMRRVSPDGSEVVAFCNKDRIVCSSPEEQADIISAWCSTRVRSVGSRFRFDSLMVEAGEERG